jgi:hypothetical protein
MTKAGFPINEKCDHCHEVATYVFSTEAARQEYFKLWAIRHRGCKEKLQTAKPDRSEERANQ